jgi:hypothetical protein
MSVALVKIFFSAVMVLANGQVMQHKAEMPSMEACQSQVHDFFDNLPTDTSTQAKAVAGACIIEYQGTPS